MNDRSQCSNQCSNGDGVCPDGRFSLINDITGVSGESDLGLVVIRYTRPLDPSDAMELEQGVAIDRSISLDGPTFIVWAIGPTSNGFPNFHTIYPGSSGKDRNFSIDFGRRVTDNGSPMVGSEEEMVSSPSLLTAPYLEMKMW